MPSNQIRFYYAVTVCTLKLRIRILSISNVTQFAGALRAQLNLQFDPENTQSLSPNSTSEFCLQPFLRSTYADRLNVVLTNDYSDDSDLVLA